MCSRFWGALDGMRVLTAIEEEGVWPLLKRYSGKAAGSKPGTHDEANGSPNIAPTETVGVIRMLEGKRVMTRMAWGFLVPGKAQTVINARIESVLERPMFASSAKERRALVPAMGFYEWEKVSKQPYCFRRVDGMPIAFAGLWREYPGGMQRFVICTGEANDLVAQIHDRMPCIVREEEYRLWLEGDAKEAVGAAMVPYAGELMESYPVTKAMSNPRYKLEDAHEPIKNLFDLD